MASKQSSTNTSADNQSCTSRTETIIQDQIANKLPTLILKLKEKASNGGNTFFNRVMGSKPAKSDDELEQCIVDNLEGFKRELFNNIDGFKDMILSARPDPAMEKEDPEGYRVRSENYKALLKLATGIATRMQESINDILKQYEQYIDELWKAICESRDVQPIRRQFDEAMTRNMNQYWKPVFDSADKLIQDANQHVSTDTAQ